MYIQKLVISSLLLDTLFNVSNVTEAIVDTLDATSSTTNLSLNHLAPSTIDTTDSLFIAALVMIGNGHT